MVRDILTGPQAAAFDVLLKARTLSRDTICERVGWNINSGHPKNVIGSMAALEIVTYPKPGYVQLVDWIK